MASYLHTPKVENRSATPRPNLMPPSVMTNVTISVAESVYSGTLVMLEVWNTVSIVLGFILSPTFIRPLNVNFPMQLLKR